MRENHENGGVPQGLRRRAKEAQLKAEKVVVFGLPPVYVLHLRLPACHIVVRRKPCYLPAL